MSKDMRDWPRAKLGVAANEFKHEIFVFPCAFFLGPKGITEDAWRIRDGMSMKYHDEENACCHQS